MASHRPWVPPLQTTPKTIGALAQRSMESDRWEVHIGLCGVGHEGGEKTRPCAVQRASLLPLHALRLHRRKGLESPPENCRASSPLSAAHRKLASCADERRMSSGENYSCCFRSILLPGSLAIQTAECVCKPPLPKQGSFLTQPVTLCLSPVLNTKGSTSPLAPRDLY